MFRARRRTAAAGVAGLEFFVGIPGSVGGAVRMNAGGHGADTDDVIVTARVVDLGDVGRGAGPSSASATGSRRSAPGRRRRRSFAGEPDEPRVHAERIDEIVRWRREHQPGGQNAGSVFTNPPGDAAGRLIEAAGCKGLRLGGAVVSEKHANFFVADPGASAADVYALIELVQRQRRTSRFGVNLADRAAPGGLRPHSGAPDQCGGSTLPRKTSHPSATGASAERPHP